jgi:hypothetical protein
MRLQTNSERFVPQTLIRGSIGGGACPRAVPWRSILRNASTTAVSTNTGSVARAAPASEFGALLVFDVNNIRYLTNGSLQ